MVDDIAGHEIGIAARQPDAAEGDHRLRHVEIDHDAAAQPARGGVGDGHPPGFGRQRAEGGVDEAGHALGVDVADHADLEVLARQDAPGIALEIVDGDAGHRFERADHRPPIGMAGEGRLPPDLAGDVIGARALALQARDGLPAHPLDVARIETRRGQREAKEMERLVLVFLQRAQGAADIIAAGLEGELDRAPLETILERLAVELAGAFVEQVDRHVGDAGLVGRVLVGAAAEGEVHGDQRHRGIAHHPDLDAAWGHQALDVGGVRRRCRRGDQHDGHNRESRKAAGTWKQGGHGHPHERFSPGRVSLMR